MNWRGMTIVGRDEWGAAPPNGSFTPQKLTTNSTLFVHWSAGSGRDIDTGPEQKATMRAIQRMHQRDRGWTDIAYGFVVFQPRGKLRRARAYIGRGPDVVPASQIGHNAGNTSVCVVMGPGEKLRRSTVRRIKSIYKRLECGSVKGHRDVGGTECPGDPLYSRLNEIREVK